MIYEKFAKSWVETYENDTVLIIDLDNILYVGGKSKELYNFSILGNKIFKEMKKEKYKYKKLKNVTLLESKTFVYCDIIGIYIENKVIGDLIICHNEYRDIDLSFIFNLINNL